MSSDVRHCHNCDERLRRDTRTDSRYCSSACRQAAYRARRARGLPPEASRTIDNDLRRYDLPHLFDVDPRPIYEVTYVRPARCGQCGREITEATLFGRSTLFKNEDGPFCLGRGCAIDAAYSRTYA
jgi:hypothetical protein